jgi:hypothetical protein
MNGPLQSAAAAPPDSPAPPASPAASPARLPAGMAALEERLAAATAEAQGARASYGADPPTAADLAELGAQARVVDLFLSDLGEALRQICVAGLSFPAPELPETLASLAERAKAHRFSTSQELLARLRLRVGAILGEPDIEARHHYARGAWAEAQRLITWLRLYRAEHDLLTVQSRMAAEASGKPAARPEAYRTRSLGVWPVGIDLASSGKLLIFALGVEGGEAVVLADHLAEFDAEAPLSSRAISRLFQDGVELRKVLASVIRLEDHPVVERGGALLFRPAFRSIPRVLPVADSFRPPALRELKVARVGHLPAGLFSLSVVARRTGGRLRVEHDGDEAPLAPSPLLRFNLSKLLLRERARSIELDLAVVTQEDRLSVLSTSTDLDGRVFIAHDPALFAVPREVLQTLAEKASSPEQGPALLFLRAATQALGGGKPARLEALCHEVEAAASAGIDDAYRLALAGALLGLELPGAKVKPLIEEALSLLAATSAEGVDMGKLARCLGRRESEVSTGDMHLIDGRVAYRAIWLAMEANLVDELRDQLARVLAARYAGELRSPGVGDVCARALLLALLSGSTPAETSAVAARPEGAAPEDEDEDEGEDEEEKDGEDAGAAVHGAAGDAAAALAFLEAHLATILPSRRTSKTPPTPEPLELVQLGDTRAFLRGEHRLGRTLEALEVPREKLRQLAVDALLDWLVEPSVAPSRGALLGAADALLAVLAAGLLPHLAS